MSLNSIWMLPNGVCITFLLLFMIVWNEIKNINLPDIANDNQLKNPFSAVKTIASLSTKNIYLDWPIQILFTNKQSVSLFFKQ